MQLKRKWRRYYKTVTVNVKDRRDIGHLVPTWEVMYEFCERFKGLEVFSQDISAAD